MAFTTVEFKHPESGETRDAPIGFSWTTLFFGFFPALFRSDWKWAGLQFLAAIVTFGFSNLVFMFIYNKLHVKGLIAKGYQTKSITKGDMKTVTDKLKIELPQFSAS